MSLADRLGLAGVILALLAIAAPYLWPDKKSIGWLSLSAAIILIAAWGWMEMRPWTSDFYLSYPIRSTFIVFMLGGILAAGVWLLAMRGSVEDKIASSDPPDNVALEKSVERNTDQLKLSCVTDNLENCSDEQIIAGLKRISDVAMKTSLERERDTSSRPMPESVIKGKQIVAGREFREEHLKTAILYRKEALKRLEITDTANDAFYDEGQGDEKLAFNVVHISHDLEELTKKLSERQH